MIDAPYISALAALAGTVAGCATSILTSRFTARSQTDAQRRERERESRQRLYERFIEEASKVYVHALQNGSTQVSMLVALYATLNEIRVVASPPLSHEADKAVRTIIRTYSSENKSFGELMKLLDAGFPDPLLAFSEACHQELVNL